MSQENVEIVRRVLELWGEGGSLMSSGLLDTEVEWVNPPNAVEPGTRRGIDAFGKAAQAVTDTIDGVRLEVDEILDAGEQVAVLATMYGRGRGSGAEVEFRLSHVWTIRDGKVVRFEWFNSATEALEAARLSE